MFAKVFEKAALCAVLLAITAGVSEGGEGASAPDQEQSDVTVMKKMSLGDLIKVEVTTVARLPSTVGQTPAAVFVITQEDIRRSGATSLPELLRRVPGIVVARIDNNKWAVGVRGFSERFDNKLLVQVDGRTVYNALFSGVYWDVVDYPLDNIERIEVVRGPGASVWGANAVNGIINILTFPASATQGGLIRAGGGTQDRGFGTFRYGGEINSDLHYRVYGKGVSRGKQFALSGDAHDAWSNASGGVRLNWRSSERDDVAIQGDLIRSDADRKDLRPMPSAPYFFTNLETETTDNGNVLARWSRQVSSNSNFAVQAYWDRILRQSDGGLFDVRIDSVDVDFQHEFTQGRRNTIVYGGGYRAIDAFLGTSKIDNGFINSFPPPDRNTRLTSAFVQDQIALGSGRVSLTLGSKFEHNSFTGFEYQPAGRLLWSPTPRHTAWGAVSRAVRTPSLYEDGISVRQYPSFPPALGGAPLFGRLTGNTDFGSEKLVAYEFGYRSQATERFSIDVASFYNVYRELRVLTPGAVMPGVAPGTFDLPLIALNGMKGETYGVELAATWQATDMWRLYGALTTLRMALHADPSVPASAVAVAEGAEGQSPRQQVFVQSSWNLPRNLEVDLIGRFVDRLSAFDPVVPRYASVDARGSWQPRPKIEIAVVGQNLFDAHHAESGTSALLRSLSVEIKRGIYGTVTWLF
jgi:iron complex outermembrane receptor protein